MIYHSEADVAALYVDAHSGVRAHNVLIELVALTVIVVMFAFANICKCKFESIKSMLVGNHFYKDKLK